jgi:hypothetical protein
MMTTYLDNKGWNDISINQDFNPDDYYPEDLFLMKHQVEVKNGEISIVEKTTEIALATFKLGSDQRHQYMGISESHVYDGNYYFILYSTQYKRASYVYSYNLAQKRIKRVLNPGQHILFFKNLLINCGDGFNWPGNQEKYNVDKAFIWVYDLSKTSDSKLVKTFELPRPGSEGYDGRINEDKETIYAFDRINNITRECRISDYLKSEEKR